MGDIGSIEIVRGQPRCGDLTRERAMFARRRKSVGGGDSNNPHNGLNSGGSHKKDRDIMNKMTMEALALRIRVWMWRRFSD
eukprot:scaffold235975_cov37-Cyclotella_meneghiniana.AAC.1